MITTGSVPPSTRPAAGRRAALAVLFAVAVALGLPTAARAGGPTSVLAVNYEDSMAGAAVVGDSTYDGLVTALNVGGLTGTAPSSSITAPPGLASANPAVRLTWFIHDYDPWRIDSIYLDGDAVWIASAEGFEGDLRSQAQGWREAEDPERLLALLVDMGALPSDAKDSSKAAAATPDAGAALDDGAAGSEPASANAESVSAASVGTPQEAEGLRTPVWVPVLAAFAALLLGVALGAGRLRRRPATPGTAAESAAWPVRG